MKLTRLAAVLMFVGAVAIACGDDETTAPLPEITVFVGTWEATVAVITSDSDPNSTLDMTLGGIATVTLTVAADSTYEFAHSVLPITVTGTFTITGADTFELTNDANSDPPLEGTFTLSNNNTELAVVLPDTELDPTPGSIYNPGTLTASFDKQ